MAPGIQCSAVQFSAKHSKRGGISVPVTQLRPMLSSGTPGHRSNHRCLELCLKDFGGYIVNICDMSYNQFDPHTSYCTHADSDLALIYTS